MSIVLHQDNYMMFPARGRRGTRSGDRQGGSVKEPPAKPQKKYETPTMVDLGEVVRGYGACQSGGAPAGGVGQCTSGATAKGKCVTGALR